MERYNNLLIVLTPFVASIAAILAWVAKIRWSKEYQLLTEKRVADVEKNATERIAAAEASAEAKVAIAESKASAAKEFADYTEKRFKALVDFGPDEIKKYFEDILNLDKLKIAELQDLLQKANAEIQEKLQEINSLKEERHRNWEVIENTEKVLSEVKKEKSYLEGKLQEMEMRLEESTVVLRIINRPEFDMEAVRNMLEQYEKGKKWILSPARHALEQKQAARHASAQAVKRKLAEMGAEEKEADYAQQHMKMEIDENKKK